MACEINRVDVNTSRRMMSISSYSKSLFKKEEKNFYYMKNKRICDF